MSSPMARLNQEGLSCLFYDIAYSKSSKVIIFAKEKYSFLVRNSSSTSFPGNLGVPKSFQNSEEIALRE